MKKRRKSFITLETKAKIRNYFFKNVKTTEDLLRLINVINDQQYTKVTPFKLSYLHYHAFQNQVKYKMFRIPKKSGGKREIIAPNNGLKGIQHTLNIILQSLYKPHISAHGFIHTRSVVTNAKKHTSKNYVYNIDLENFFPSIHQARVWKRLQTPPFRMPKEVANLISALTCYQYDQGGTKRVEKVKNFLPQGASTSPVISNIICERLDKKLIGIAKRFNLTYTRYADDITFSSNHNVYQNNSPFLEELKKIIADEHFTINTSKTRLQKKGTRQVVTGLVVNENVNVPRGYIKKLRMLIHILEKYGVQKAKLIYIQHQGKSSKDILHVISGKLEYLKMIKGSENSTYVTLKNRFDACFSDEVSKFKQEFTLYEIKNLEKHNPKKMLELLNNFDTNRLLKSTITLTINNEQYSSFMKDLKIEWDRLYREYEHIVHKNLLSKIYQFLFQKKVTKFGWGSQYKKIGWSSLELAKWVKNNPSKSPFEFIVIQDNSEQSIERFEDVIIAFKNEIKVSPNGESLYNLFFNYFNNYEDEEIRPSCTWAEENILKEIEFYVDTQQLKKIFETIASIFSHVKSELKVIKTENYLELRLCSLGGLYGQENEMFENEFYGRSILDNIVSTCDFRIEHNYSDTHKIDFLGDTNIPITEEIKGTTFVLRFYLKV